MSNDGFITLIAAVAAIGLFVFIARKIGKIAQRRGRDFYRWAIFGFILPVPAIVSLYVLPNRAPPDLSLAARQF